MWDYSEKVMDHYRNPRNVGTIEDADAVGSAGSLTCGDQLKIYLKIKDNVVTDAKSYILEGFAYSSLKYGSIASSTCSSTLVVALLSKYTNFVIFIPLLL